MAEIAPLTPLRYDLARLPGGLASVVAPPYDVISPAERDELAARHPHNLLRLILPAGDAAFYRYDQSFRPPAGAPGAERTITRRGFLGLVRLVPFSDRVVLPHERTLSGPKEDRLKLFRATATNLSPGFMLYRDARGELDAPLGRAEP